MRPLLAQLLLLSSLVPLQEAEPKLRQELDPRTGLRIEAEVGTDRHGAEVLDGKYAAFHPDGSRAIQGRYDKGQRRGTWRWWYPAGGRLQLEGSYSDGLRVGEWKAWDEDGNVDASESGLYSVLDSHWPGQGRRRRGEQRALGELLDGVPHGSWSLWREDGTPMARGEMRHGRRHGVWLFWHADGSLDPEWITGEYADGERIRSLGAEELPESIAPDPARAPLLLFEAGLSDELRERARACMADFCAPEGAEPEGQEKILLAAKRLRALGRGADAPILAALCDLDPSDPADAGLGKRIEVELLAPLVGAARFGWRDGATPQDLEHDRLVVLRWHSLLGLLRLDPACAQPADPLAPPSLLLDVQPSLPLPLEDSPEALEAVLPLLGQRLTGRDELSKRRRETLDGALQWLADHQSADGRWSCSAFMHDSASGRKCDCGGPGNSLHDVGLTALALLALQGDGNTTRRGTHQDVVSRAVGWLLAQQDPTSGLFGERLMNVFLYDHGIATLALSETMRTTGAEGLREPLQAAVHLIQRARNPYSGWRYELPPIGENDTSVTAWMVSALDSARAAGLSVESAAFEGALAWIDAATDEATGRCGYDSKGSLSARVPQLNVQFPPENGEAMTAAAILTRFLAGQDLKSQPMLAAHARLLAARLPRWDVPGCHVDYYYWYWGSQALHQYGGPIWEAWDAALERALLDSQREDGHQRGSWDPVGPWCFAAGRVYSTAMGALCLEAGYRLPLVGQAH